MTNEDKLREIFPKTIFVQHKESDKLTALICSDEWLNAEYQEPRKGHWIYIGQSYLGSLKICECSNCKKRTYGSHNYCPNCGAKMIEPQESEDKE